MSLLAIRLPEIIGLTILHSLWQITLLWIVLVAVLSFWPKASSTVRYTMAISTLILSVFAIAATAVYEWQMHKSSEVISVVLANVTMQTKEVEYTTIPESHLARILVALKASVPILAWLWCAGLVVMGARFGGSVFYLRTLRAQKNITALSPVWEQELKRLSRALGLRCEVVIATSARISSPLTLGSISPIILLPAGLLAGLSTAQIETILVHELYHIKRRDYVINICQALVEVLLFYHPAIWHINHIIREERENCCDDQTVKFCGDAIAYARALTQIQEINTFNKPTLAMSATGPNAGNFTNRVKRLFHIYPNPAQARSKGLFAIGFLIVYLCIVLASANVLTAHPFEREKKPVKTNVNDHTTTVHIFSDSIAVRSRLHVVERKETTSRTDAGEKNRSMDIQNADTTVSERSLDKCLQQVKLILKMASLTRLPDGRLRFPEFLPQDSIQVVGSMDFLSKTNFEFQPRRFSGAINPARIKSGLIDTAGNETTKEEHPGTFAEEFTAGRAVQVFPNSTNGYLNIIFTPSRNNSQVKMVLSDLDGKVLKEITDSTYENMPTELRVDVTSFKKGIYILQINIDGARSQQRVVVE